MPNLAGIYSKVKRVGMILKDSVSGKIIDEWNKAVSEVDTKPELVEISPAVSALLAVKDDEELVRVTPLWLLSPTEY